jgi:hypothetical protein
LSPAHELGIRPGEDPVDGLEAGDHGSVGVGGWSASTGSPGSLRRVWADAGRQNTAASRQSTAAGWPLRRRRALFRV